MADRPAHHAWYKASARDFDCNQHPAQPKALAKMVAEFTGVSPDNAAHIMDRIHHLNRCLGEPESLTLFRLQPGKNQPPKNRDK